MKANNFLLFISLLLFCGCGTVKKTAVSTTVNDSTAVKTSREIDTSTLIDTTKIDGKIVSIVKVEFFPDTPVPDPKPITPEAAPDKPNETKEAAPLPPTSRPVNSISANGKTISGSIKSAEIIEIASESEIRGKTEKETTEETETEIVSTTDLDNNEEVTPEKDPRRFLWLAILIAVGLVATLVVYNKFIKPLNLGGKIRSLVGKFGNLLKNE